MSSLESDLRQKYEENWDPENYLEVYVTGKNPWEESFVRNLHDFINSGKVKGPRGIDIGCGPTVHRMSMLARVCDEILACDYTPSNLEFVKSFLEADGPVGAVSHTLQEVAKIEDHKDLSAGEQELCERLRSKVKNVVRVDVTNPESVSNLLNYGGQFDCAHSNGALEAACLTYESYVSALKSINKLLKPGAAFVLSGYINGDFYDVNSVRFECWKWDADTAKRGLEEAGFKVESLTHFEAPPISGFCNCMGGFSSISYKI